MKHKKIFVSTVALALVLLQTTPVFAIASIGHFDDTSWSGLHSSTGYKDISVDITIDVWNGGSDAYYYSNNAYLSNGTNIYGGLQTNGNNGTKAVGKMAIFSIWNATSAIAEPGGTKVAFSGEGTGYSVRLPYNWSPGITYRFKMYIDQDATTGNRLWGGSVTNISSGQTTRIGRIYAPVSYGKIRNPITFHERYIGGTSSCSQMSSSQVRFGNMTANSGTIKASSWNHYVIKSLAECPGSTWLSDGNDGYTHGINTAKPAPPIVAIAPTQAGASKTPVQPKNAQTTPATTKAAAAPTVTPDTSPLPEFSNLATVPVKEKPLSKLRIFLTITGFGLFTFALVCAWKYHKSVKYRRYIKKYFPYDFDIHGPRFS